MAKIVDPEAEAKKVKRFELAMAAQEWAVANKLTFADATETRNAYIAFKKGKSPERKDHESHPILAIARREMFKQMLENLATSKDGLTVERILAVFEGGVLESGSETTPSRQRDLAAELLLKAQFKGALTAQVSVVLADSVL